MKDLKRFKNVNSVYQFNTLFFPHVVAIVRIHEAVEVRTAGTTDGGRLTDQCAADGDGVDLTTFVLIPAGDNDSGRKLKKAMTFTALFLKWN